MQQITQPGMIFICNNVLGGIALEQALPSNSAYSYTFLHSMVCLSVTAGCISLH